MAVGTRRWQGGSHWQPTYANHCPSRLPWGQSHGAGTAAMGTGVPDGDQPLVPARPGKEWSSSEQCSPHGWLPQSWARAPSALTNRGSSRGAFPHQDCGSCRSRAGLPSLRASVSPAGGRAGAAGRAQTPPVVITTPDPDSPTRHIFSRLGSGHQSPSAPPGPVLHSAPAPVAKSIGVPRGRGRPRAGTRPRSRSPAAPRCGSTSRQTSSGTSKAITPPSPAYTQGRHGPIPTPVLPLVPRTALGCTLRASTPHLRARCPTGRRLRPHPAQQSTNSASSCHKEMSRGLHRPTRPFLAAQLMADRRHQCINYRPWELLWGQAGCRAASWLLPHVPTEPRGQP